MTVNGKARWTCRTHVAKIADSDTLEIAPLDNLPIIKDLATDMTEFFDKMSKAVGYFKGEQTRHDDFAKVKPDSEERQLANAGIECIGCGVCYASCEVVSARESYLGPAALNRAWTLVNDERDSQQLIVCARLPVMQVVTRATPKELVQSDARNKLSPPLGLRVLKRLWDVPP